MGAEEIWEDSEKFESIKDSHNPVQIIFDESFTEDTKSNFHEISPRISTPISTITDNLILTSATFVTPQTIEQLGVSCIISCAPELPNPPLLQEHIIYYKIDTLDVGVASIHQYFDSTADLIQQILNLGGKTLVYCVAGVSRSATICIAYLMKYHKLTLLQAYNFVKAKRPKIKPNCGFFRQLIDYEKTLFGCNSVDMVFNETVKMEIPDVYDVNYQNPFLLITKRRKEKHLRN